MKNKHLAYLLLLICCLRNVYSQQLLYTLQTNENSYFSSIINETGSNNYLITNYNANYSSLQYTKNQILKISPTGVVLDSLNFNPNFLFFGPVVAANNFYYCYGAIRKVYSPKFTTYSNILYKINQNLDIVQQIITDTTYNEGIFENRIVVKNNHLYLGSTRANYASNVTLNTLHFYKVDFNLIKKDSAIFNGNALDAFASYGNKLLVCGGPFAMGSPYGNSQVMELDTNFNVLSRFNLDSLSYVNPGCGEKIGISGGSSISFHSLSSNKYAVIGCYPVVTSANCANKYQNITAIIKNNSQVLKSNIIGSTYKDNVITGNAASSMRYNYIYTAATVGYNQSNPLPPQTNTTQVLVHKIDTAGNLIWAKYFDEPNFYYIAYGTCATADSGVVVSGMRYNLQYPIVQNICEGFIMKLDKSGNQQYVGIKNNTGGFSTNYHKCYPNPANNSLYFDLPLQENIEIKLYTAIGQQVLLETNYQNISQINISGLSNGTYFYKIKTKKNNYSGKFIKE